MAGGQARMRGGTAGPDVLEGGPGLDTLDGGAGNDVLFGSGDGDRLFGGSGNDALHGRGRDWLLGGANRDVYFVKPGDKVFEKPGEGFDSVHSSYSYRLLPGQSVDVMVPTDYFTGYDDPIKFFGNELNQVIWGNSGRNVLEGRGGNDRLLGNQGDDTLRGGTGKDALYGHFGRDTLEGGQGKDIMYGGSEQDRFVYRSVADSTAKNTGRDAIQDFSQSEHDVIDLHRIDANRGKAGNQGFHFIEDDDFSGKAGELRAEISRNNTTLVSADVNGDGKADFAIVVYGSIAFDKGDFVL